MYTLSDVRYDEASHTSSLPDGRDVPHVTRILDACGISSGFDGVPQSQMAFAGLRGTAVHADCHAYDDNDLDESQVDARVLPYVRAWAQFRENLRIRPVSRERRVYSATWNYTGRMDGIFEVADVGLVLIDIKTGDPDSAGGHLQTAAYELAEREQSQQQIQERWAVWLRPEREIPYTVVNYTRREDGWMDYQKWMACLTVFAEQHGRRAVVR